MSRKGSRNPVQNQNYTIIIISGSLKKWWAGRPLPLTSAGLLSEYTEHEKLFFPHYLFRNRQRIAYN